MPIKMDGGQQMGGVVILRGVPVDLSSELGHAFVVDAVRAAEALLTDQELAEKYELSPADWQAITKNSALGHAVRAERERRVRDGSAVREMSAKHLVKGPGILDSIMANPQANNRHRIEAFKELRQTAAIGGTDKLPESARFIISIDLTAGGGTVEHFDVPREPMKIASDEAVEGKTDGDE
jgi:hypothetical protein